MCPSFTNWAKNSPLDPLVCGVGLSSIRTGGSACRNLSTLHGRSFAAPEARMCRGQHRRCRSTCDFCCCWSVCLQQDGGADRSHGQSLPATQCALWGVCLAIALIHSQCVLLPAHHQQRSNLHLRNSLNLAHMQPETDAAVVMTVPYVRCAITR